MNEFSKEENFITMLQAVLKKAQKNHNVISRQDLQDAFGDLQLDDAQMKQVENYLHANNIGVDEALPLEDVLTEEEHNYLKDYEEMVSRIEQPSEGELEALEIQAMAGEADAQRRLAETMLSDVVDIAKLYIGQGVYMEDLIGIGNEALMRGVKLLAPLDKPSEVKPDLAQRIMTAMEDLIAEDMDQTVVGQDAADLTNKVKEKADELAADLGRKVTVEELAAEGDVTEDEIMDAIRISANKIDSIDYKQA